MTPESEALIDGFALSLRAENKSPRTVETYTEAVGQFADYLEETNDRREADPRWTRIARIVALVGLAAAWINPRAVSTLLGG